ncbi:haloacid dehalogenase-like hydrolase domain-containing protein 2 [Ptychodera flava]|uniref:haloacid dehalogenase-like hydrolase domain-containing protein 2 n=1 Tax=Ptychodera flava TaxID=63121 RepID=UPI00396A1605
MLRAMSLSASRIGAVLVDLSGTLHIDNTAIPGAVEAVQRLRKTNLSLRFVTNTTKECKAMLHGRLESLGFDIKEDEIFTSLTAAKTLVEKQNLRPLLLLQDTAMKDFEGRYSYHDANAVVVGLAPDCFNYEMMNKAFRLVLEGHPLIAIHKARYYKRSDGLALGPGPFVEALEYAADTTATVVGKPQQRFFLSALNGLGCSAENTVMIGDDVRDDVGGAQKAGMQGILVQTGKYRDLDETKIAPSPAAVCKDFPAAVDVIIEHLNQPNS